jgi:TetR/AcrR family transcriptional repressor of nem operon
MMLASSFYLVQRFLFMTMVRQFNEEAVLEKVLEVFWAQGWQATSMAQLAAASEVQRGSLYHAYGSKEQLFRMAFERYSTGVLAASRAALSGPTVRLALQNFFKVSIDDMTGHLPPRGCFTTKTAVESEHLGEEIQSRVRSLVAGLEGVLVDALSREAFRVELNNTPQRSAALIIAFTRGLAVMERVCRDHEQLRRLSSDFVDLLLIQRA